MKPQDIAAEAVLLFAATFGGGFVVGYCFCIKGLNDAIRFISSIRILPETGESCEAPTPAGRNESGRKQEREGISD